MPRVQAEEITTLASRKAIVAYLDVVAADKPRGRRRTRDNVVAQLEQANNTLYVAETGFEKLIATKNVMALEAEIAAMDAADNHEELEAEFIAKASVYAEAKEIPRAAFRAVGVPARVLTEAGIN